MTCRGSISPCRWKQLIDNCGERSLAERTRQSLVSEHSPVGVRFQQQWSLRGQVDIPSERREGRKCLVMSPADEVDASAPLRQREADQVAPGEPAIVFDGRERARDHPFRNVDAAVKTVVPDHRV